MTQDRVDSDRYDGDMKELREQLSLTRISELKAEGKLSGGSFERLLDFLTSSPQKNEWSAFLRFWFLVFASALMVSGILYFCAFNWNLLSRLQKFGALQALILAFSIGVVSRGLSSRVGQICLAVASVLTGVLLAVMGQAYQSQADSYLLFLAWAGLVLPWTLAARNNFQWLLWMGLANLSLGFYVSQYWEFDPISYLLTHLALNAGFWLLWRIACRRRQWMWRGVCDILLAVGLAPLNLHACAAFWDSGFSGVSLLVVVLVLGFLFADRWSVSQTTIAFTGAIALTTSFLARWLLEIELLGFLFIGVAILAQMAFAFRVLKSQHQSQVVTQPKSSGDLEKVDPDSREEASVALSEKERQALAKPGEDVPLYVKALVAMGSWAASWFFLGFVALFLDWDSEVQIWMSGLFLCFVSCKLRRDKEWTSPFLLYCCLSVHLAGQLCILIGSWELFSFGLSGLSLCLLTAALSFVFYPDRLGRFLFSLAFVVLGTMWLSELLGGRLGGEIWLAAVAVAICGLVLREKSLWERGLEEFSSPAILGLTTGLLSLQMIDCTEGKGSLIGFVVMSGLCGALLYLRGFRRAAIGLGLMGILSPALVGVSTALLSLLLGFESHRRVMRGAAVLFLLAFGALFYYQLSLSLAWKSGMLMLSGLCFLVLRVLVPKEGSSDE